MADDAVGDDRYLVRRCADGDEEAWATFVDRYGPLLTGLARRMLSRRAGRAPNEDVDDVVAEVFLALLREDGLLLRRYDPAWRLSTYLGVICRTAVVRLLKRRRHRGDAVRTPLGDVADPRGLPEGLAALTSEEREEVLSDLRKALDALSARDRLLLTLRFVEELDYRAIAEAVGVSPESVGPLLHRAKGRLARRADGLRGLVTGEDFPAS